MMKPFGFFPLSVKLRWMVQRALRVGAFALLCGAACADDLAIKGARIVPVVGEPIEAGTILIRDGKIMAIGKDLAIPVEAKVIEATGKVVLPGFVDPHSSTGLVQPNEVNPNVPFITVVDGLDPNADYFENARRNGITTAAVVPGNNTMIGGQAAVAKTAGSFADEMILKRDAGLKISLRPSAGRSRMSHLAALRKEFEETKKYIANREKKAKEAEKKAADVKKQEAEKKEEPKNEPEAKKEEPKKEGEAQPKEEPKPEPPDPLREPMVKLLQGELPAFIYCEAAMDVPQALRLIDEFKLKAILVLGPDCYKAASLIAESKLPVILDPLLVFWETDPRTDLDKQVILPRIYREAGVPVTFQTAEGGTGLDQFGRGAGGGGVPLGSAFPWYQAAIAVKYGTPTAEALEALTLRPAKLLGVDEFVGSIEPGKDADLVIWTTDPLSAEAWVDTTIVGGKVVYRKEEDAKLRDLLNPPKDGPKPAEPK
jgi:imidazolonepropionase-like amidohydrolase